MTLQKGFFTLLTGSVLLTAAFFTPALAAEGPASFTDIPSDAWYAEAAADMSRLGLMSGTAPSAFSPEVPASRAMMAAILYRMAGSPVPEEDNFFFDVAADAWYAGPVLWASQAGYIQGYGNGLFAPEEPVTREQLVTLLWRYAGSPVPETGPDFSDKDYISEWAVSATAWAQSIGLITGKQDGRFDPAGLATRAETAVILQRFVEYMPAGGGTQTPAEEDPLPPSDTENPPEVDKPVEGEDTLQPSTPEPPAGESEAAASAIPLNEYEAALFTVTDGFLSYFGVPECYAGVDVSSYQGEIDWDRVAAAGIDFAIIRVGYRGYTEGLVYDDRYFVQNIEGALDAGLDVGVYFYSQATTADEAVEEALRTLSAIDGYPITYPVVFDWERVSNSSSRTRTVTGETIASCALAFCETVESAGYRTMIYGNTSDVANGDLDLSQLLDYPFWLAHYTSSWEPTDFPYHYDMWQYTSHGSVDGIDGRVDLNLCLTSW